MESDVDAEALEEEIEEPPIRLLAMAVGGIGLAVVGVLVNVVALVGYSAAVVSAVPALGVVFDLSVPITIVGIGLFFVAMTEWSPDLS